MSHEFTEPSPLAQQFIPNVEPKVLSRRTILRGALLAGASLLAEACSGPGNDGNTAPTGTSNKASSGEATPTSPENPFASKPTWEQDFKNMPDGTKLDEKVWNVVSGTTEADYNSEAETNTGRPKNLRIEGGALLLEAHREHKDGKDITSARINTQGKKAFTNGKIEIDCKMPEGVGPWPAGWLLYDNLDTGNWPDNGEIDFAETVGFERNKIFPAVHTASTEANGQEDLGTVKVPEMYTDFVTYGIQKSPGKIEFTLKRPGGEEKVVKTIERQPSDTHKEWPFDEDKDGNPQEFSLILDLAMGGDWGGQKKSKAHPDGIEGDGPWTMAVSGVRFYDYEGK